MDQGGVGTRDSSTDAGSSVEPSTPGVLAPGVTEFGTQPAGETTDAAAPRRRPLALDLTLLGVVGILLLAAIGAGVATLYEQFYSPTAFVLRYLHLLEDKRATDALAMPGVTVDSSTLVANGLPLRSSEALLRSATLGSLTDIHTVSTVQHGDTTEVTVAYTAGGHPGVTSFDVESAGRIGVAPAWRFARSPLAVIDLRVHGSMQFTVNGFEVDKRQLSHNADQEFLSPFPLLVFSPGIYSVTVDTPISETDGVAVLSNTPMKATPIKIEAQPTERFKSTVQKKVQEYLTACAKQKVLQPTGCPFGYVVENRIDAPPTWTMKKQPAITLTSEGAGWRIQPAPATAHIKVDVRSLFDGSVRHVDEDMPIVVTGRVKIQPDGTAAISVAAADGD